MLRKRQLVILACLIMAAFTFPAFSQTSGTITISGRVSAVYKLTSGGASTLSGDSGGAVTSSAADAAVASVVDFGDVGPGNTNAVVCFTQPLYLRTNASTSAMKAQVTASSGFGAGTADVKLSDIGIGFTSLTANGPNASVAGTSITAGYTSDPCTATLDGSGVPSFAATNSLNLLSASTALVSATSPISLRGNFNSPNNAATTTLKLAMLPQSYTENAGFSATLTLTMGTP